MRLFYLLILSSSTLLPVNVQVSSVEDVQQVYNIKPSMPTEEMIIEEIERQARSANIPITTAVRIARCESSLNPNAKNKTSSATGLYQFTEGTWEHIGAVGSRTDYKENIAQFMKWYPLYPSWWECT